MENEKKTLPLSVPALSADRQQLGKFPPDTELYTAHNVLRTSYGKLMDQVRQVLRYHHYAYRTELTYCNWIVRYIKFHGSKKHPRDMGKCEIKAFLCHQAVDHDKDVLFESGKDIT